MRQPATDLGGIDGAGVTYLQAAAEKIDAPDASFDIVSGATPHPTHVPMHACMHVGHAAGPAQLAACTLLLGWMRLQAASVDQRRASPLIPSLPPLPSSPFARGRPSPLP